MQNRQTKLIVMLQEMPSYATVVLLCMKWFFKLLNSKISELSV